MCLYIHVSVCVYVCVCTYMYLRVCINRCMISIHVELYSYDVFVRTIRVSYRRAGLGNARVIECMCVYTCVTYMGYAGMPACICTCMCT